MVFEVITGGLESHPSGFTTSQFKKLDALYLKAVSLKTLNYRAVECDFDEGMAMYTYYKVVSQAPYLQFVIRKVGPRASMYELFLQGKGRIAKSGNFERVYERLRDEVEKLSA